MFVQGVEGAGAAAPCRGATFDATPTVMEPPASEMLHRGCTVSVPTEVGARAQRGTTASAPTVPVNVHSVAHPAGPTRKVVVFATEHAKYGAVHATKVSVPVPVKARGCPTVRAAPSGATKCVPLERVTGAAEA